MGFLLWWGSWDLSIVTVLWHASLALTDSSLRRLTPTRGRGLPKGNLEFLLWWGSWDLSLVTVLWHASLALTDSPFHSLAPTRGRIYLLIGNVEFLLWWGP